MTMLRLIWMRVLTVSGSKGAGGVARSATGFLGAWCKPHDGVKDPLIVEALSLRDGVLYAKLRGLNKVVMEMDCKEVVDLWNTCHHSRSVVAPILLEIGDLSASFSSFIIQLLLECLICLLIFALSEDVRCK